MEFGNWLVTSDTIIWNQPGLKRFIISKETLLAKTEIGDYGLYQSILTATEEDWLTQNDLYDLNFAIVYAAAKFNLDFNYEVFDLTLAEQYEQFEEEDDEF